MIPLLFSVQLSVLLYLCMVSLPYLLTPSATEHQRVVDDYVHRHLAKLRRRQLREEGNTIATTTRRLAMSY